MSHFEASRSFPKHLKPFRNIPKHSEASRNQQSAQKFRTVYCIFHFLNQSSLKVKPMLMRKIFSLIRSLAERFTH